MEQPQQSASDVAAAAARIAGGERRSQCGGMQACTAVAVASCFVRFVENNRPRVAEGSKQEYRSEKSASWGRGA